jgi:hypothetical protein
MLMKIMAKEATNRFSTVKLPAGSFTSGTEIDRTIQGTISRFKND